MRRIQTLGLSCIAAVSCAAVAETPARSASDPAAYEALDRSVEMGWQAWTAYATPGPLRHLNGSPCQERYGCTTSAASREPVEPQRDYIDALDLGDYGPMNFKFTGDRVKLKVRF